MKLDGRLDRNFLAGVQGDAINALLCGAGYNLRLILNYLAALLRALLQVLANNQCTTEMDPENGTSSLVGAGAALS